MGYSRIAVVVFFGLLGSAYGQSQYTITDLGTLGGTRSDSAALNVLGQVCGRSFPAGDAVLRSFRTAPNAVINPATDDLGTLGGSRSRCHAMNSSGQAAGWSLVTGDPTFGTFGFLVLRAIRTAPNTPINPATDNLGTLGGSSSAGRDINETGQVVGESYLLGDSRFHAFRTGPNQAIDPSTDDLGTLGGDSTARAINASGQVVGESVKAFSLSHAFRTAPNASINPATDDIGTLGGNFSTGNDINDAGQVVGCSTLVGGSLRAFRTAPNAAINPATDDLGSLGGTSCGQGINSAGDVVGNSSDATFSVVHAFLYKSGTLYDLNTLIPAGSGWILEEAVSINDVGQIAGTGTINGQEHAFRLDPPIESLIENFISQISDPRLGLNQGEQNALTASLEKALESIPSAADSFATAFRTVSPTVNEQLGASLANQLRAVATKIEAFHSSGRLTDAQAATLIASINRILLLL